MYLSRSGLGLSLIAACLAAGCGGKQPGATVTGKVTLNGAPLDAGVVTFFPVGDVGTTGTGALGPDASYSLLGQSGQEGIEPGDYTVVVMPTMAQLRKSQGDPQLQVKTFEIPLQYTTAATSPLKRTIAPGANAIDLALENEPPRK